MIRCYRQLSSLPGERQEESVDLINVPPGEPIYSKRSGLDVGVPWLAVRHHPSLTASQMGLIGEKGDRKRQERG